MPNFTKTTTEIDGLCIITPQIFNDERGYFMETYEKQALAELGITANFIQDNQSGSKKGVLRGLHFQTEHPQAKLVRVLHGEVFDVAVDLRQNSKTYGKWHAEILSAKNKKQFFIPRGFAHGFLVLSDTAEFSYKVDNSYDPAHEQGIIYNDPEINITWPALDNYILSDKDQSWPTLKEYTK